MANWFKKALDDIGDFGEDAISEIGDLGKSTYNMANGAFQEVKNNPVKSLALGPLSLSAMAMKGAGQTAFKEYQYRNGGKSAADALRASQEAMDLEESQIAARQTASDSAIASSRYGSFGGALGTTSSPTKKKSILGGF